MPLISKKIGDPAMTKEEYEKLFKGLVENFKKEEEAGFVFIKGESIKTFKGIQTSKTNLRNIFENKIVTTNYFKDMLPEQLAFSLTIREVFGDKKAFIDIGRMMAVYDRFNKFDEKLKGIYKITVDFQTFKTNEWKYNKIVADKKNNIKKIEWVKNHKVIRYSQKISKTLSGGKFMTQDVKDGVSTEVEGIKISITPDLNKGLAGDVKSQGLVELFIKKGDYEIVYNDINLYLHLPEFRIVNWSYRNDKNAISNKATISLWYKNEYGKLKIYNDKSTVKESLENKYYRVMSELELAEQKIIAPVSTALGRVLIFSRKINSLQLTRLGGMFEMNMFDYDGKIIHTKSKNEKNAFYNMNLAVEYNIKIPKNILNFYKLRVEHYKTKALEDIKNGADEFKTKAKYQKEYESEVAKNRKSVNQNLVPADLYKTGFVDLKDYNKGGEFQNEQYKVISGTELSNFRK